MTHALLAAGHDDVRAGVELLADGRRHDARRRFLAGGKLLQAGLRDGQGDQELRRTAKRLLSIASALVALCVEGVEGAGLGDARSHTPSDQPTVGTQSSGQGLGGRSTPEKPLEKRP